MTTRTYTIYMTYIYPNHEQSRRFRSCSVLHLLPPATWARFCDAAHFIGMLGMRDRRYQKTHIGNQSFGHSNISNQGINPQRSKGPYLVLPNRGMAPATCTLGVHYLTWRLQLPYLACSPHCQFRCDGHLDGALQLLALRRRGRPRPPAPQ